MTVNSDDPDFRITVGEVDDEGLQQVSARCKRVEADMSRHLDGR